MMPDPSSKSLMPPSRKVLTFKNSLLPPSETFILEQVAAFERWKNRLFGYTREPGGLSLSAVDHDVLWPNLHPLVVRYLDRICGKRLNAWQGARRIAAWAPNLVHTHFGNEVCRHWNLFSRLDVPIVVTLHGRDITVRPEVWDSGRLGRINVGYPAQLRSLASDGRVHFVAVSDWIRRAAEAFGLPADTIPVHHIGVDVERFKPAPDMRLDPPVVLFVGRLVEKKGVAWLLRAMPAILSEHPGARLVLIGDGPMRSGLVAAAAESGVPAEFLGAQSPAVVLEWMRKAAVLCLPSVTGQDGDAEGFGMVLLEAQSCGTPVVTSAKGGADEGIEDGVTGYAVEERDVEAIADRVSRILGSESLRMAMSIAARERVVERFDIRACTRSLEDRYEQILSSTRRFER